MPVYFPGLTPAFCLFLCAVVEVYSNLWGAADCFKPQLQRLYFANMDKCNFCVVSVP